MARHGNRVAALALLVTLSALHVQVAAESSEGPLVCPNSCSGNGECVKGVRLCMSTYTGADCSVEVKTLVYFALTTNWFRVFVR